MSNAYDIGNKVHFTANVINLDDYEGIQFVIDFNSNVMESPELMFLNPDEILGNTHSSPHKDVMEEPPPHVASYSSREQICKLNNVDGKVN